MELYLSAALLRFCESAMQAAPTIMIGFLVAAIFARMMSPAQVRTLFVGGRGTGLMKSWLLGMLLPVCSLGAIPIVRELARQKIPMGSILAFAITAPLFNPISVLYGLTLSSPIVIFTFCLASLLIVTVVGLAWDWLFPEDRTAPKHLTAIAPGIKRLLGVVYEMARQVWGPSAIYIALGLLGITVLSLALPHSSLQYAAEPNDAWAPLGMATASVLIYATPIKAMVQIASMFEHGNSVGAAFSLLVLGTGINLGLIVWLISDQGFRRAATWLCLLFAVVVGLAYAVDKPLYPSGIEAAGHTHAFDDYCFPFAGQVDQPFQEVSRQLSNRIEPHEIVGLLILAVLMALGLLFLATEKRLSIATWLTHDPQHRSQYDPYLPESVLWSASFGLLMVFSLLGCFLYYPPEREIFEEIKSVNIRIGSAALSQDWSTAEHWIPVAEDWVHKLTVSSYLRQRPPTPFLLAKKSMFLEKLELLEHAIEDREAEEAKRLGLDCQNAFRRLRAAYIDTWPQQIDLKK